eukprot:RCo044391
MASSAPPLPADVCATPFSTASSRVRPPWSREDARKRMQLAVTQRSIDDIMRTSAAQRLQEQEQGRHLPNPQDLRRQQAEARNQVQYFIGHERQRLQDFLERDYRSKLRQLRDENIQEDFERQRVASKFRSRLQEQISERSALLQQEFRSERHALLASLMLPRGSLPLELRAYARLPPPQPSPALQPLPHVVGPGRLTGLSSG